MVPAQTAYAVIARNPFDMFERERIAVRAGQTVADLARSLGLDPKRAPLICQVNGRWVLQKMWGVAWVAAGAVVAFMTVPQGGDRGVLGTVLQIALVVAAVAAGPFVAGALGLAGTAYAVVSAVTSAAVIAGGSALINAVVPPAPPAQGDYSSANTPGGVNPSPTYSLQAQGNVARLGQPRPVHYGRHIAYPDLAASPYSTFEDNEQFLYQVLELGEGAFDIEASRIGEAALSSFKDVTTEVVGPDAVPTLFDVNVYTAQEIVGQTLRGTNERGNGDDGWVGPFPACPSDETTTRIGVDIVFPGGLVNAGGRNATVNWSVEARKIDSLGRPVAPGTFMSLASETRTLQTTTPQRLSFDYRLPSAARWEVRVRRTNAKDMALGARDDAQWSGLRGTLTTAADYSGSTVILVKARATDQLNSATARRFNFIATRKVAIWNGTEWSAPTATTSIAWAAADLLRNDTYGLGLDDAQIDLDGLLALDRIWSARGDQFNARFDQPSTVWEALTKICRAGRAQPYQQAGLVRFHRDAPQTVPVTMFTISNIALDSFNIEVALPKAGETADGVEAEYFNDAVWKPDSVIRGVGDAVPDNPVPEQLFGVTRTAQATNEAAYQAAQNQLRRQFVTFETELEGLIPSHGDLALIAHDVPSWGDSGEVTAWDAETRTVTLSKDVTFADARNHFMRLRATNGAVSKTVPVSPGPAANRVVLASAPLLPDDTPFTVEVSGTKVRTLFTFAHAGFAPREAIVTNIVPRGNRVQIQAVIESPRVHVN